MNAAVSVQPKWQRFVLLTILAYEGLGALVGGMLLVAAPNGKFMNMPVTIMHGFFPDFLIPGMILTGLGVLTAAAFLAVLRHSRFDWVFSGLALGGLLIWFIVEISILQQVHWLHIMWGIPVIVGSMVALARIPRRQ